jgi:hypothetical protein
MDQRPALSSKAILAALVRKTHHQPRRLNTQLTEILELGIQPEQMTMSFRLVLKPVRHQQQHRMLKNRQRALKNLAMQRKRKRSPKDLSSVIE